MKKKCSKCKKSIDVSEFRLEMAHLDGLRSSCRNCDNLTNRKPKRKLKRLLNRARERAKIKNLSFDLDEVWVANRIEGCCEITGKSFSFVPHIDGYSKNPHSPSIDRINSKRGYTKDNCRLVIWAYNVAKQDWSDDIVYSWAKSLIDSVPRRLA